MHRFAAFAGSAPTGHSDVALARAAAAGTPLATLCDLGWAWLATTDPAPKRACDGAVIGTIFRAGETKPVEHLSPNEAAAIARSDGGALIEHYWGGYVAVLFDPDRRRATVVRAPFGELPCLFAESGRGVALASDMALLRSVTGQRPGIDVEAVSRHLAIRDVRAGPACLGGVGELHGGERLHATPRPSVTALWTPWRFGAPDERIETLPAAAAAVRAATLATVAARATAFTHPLLMLSGGLDSSIVAAAMAHDGRRFDSLTLTTRDLAGDETAFAATTSAAVACPLHTIVRDVANVDITRSDAAGLPRPTARAFAQESRRAAAAIAAETGADAVLTGGGGDNIFCSLQSGAAAADRLRVAGPGPTFLRSVRDMSMVATASMWAVGRDAVARALRGRPAPPRLDLRLLSDDAARAARRAPAHDWLAVPPGTLPGTAAHARLLVYAQSLAESANPLDALTPLSPLLGQPLVETCLRVPSWLWFAGGRNRSVARAAFAGDLPAAIIERRSKGSPESFVAEIFERNRGTLAELLRGGWLWTNGVIDQVEVARLLDDPRPAHGTGFMRLLEFADVEAWARAWS